MTVEVGALDEETCFLCALLRNKRDGFKWEVVVVYDPVQHDKSKYFLEELTDKGNITNYLWL
jgi:hypothetical protein